MSYIRARPRRPRHDFSLTIVNVVFLLLLFYLATGSLIKQSELAADVPLTLDLPLERLPRPLLLIARDGSLALDGIPVTMDELLATARSAMKTARFLNVLAERSMPGSGFLEIVAEIDRAAIPIRIVTLRAAPEAAGPDP